ncbi:MAG TPA: LLM class flavin-dependent oxidoreductase, partial [Chloroflexota bacterium]
DSAEFAARKRVGLGLAFTDIPRAADAARFYREKAAEYGWQPTPDMIIYQAAIYVGRTDEEAMETYRQYAGREGTSAGTANRLVANAGFYGERDMTTRMRYQNINAERTQTLESQVERGQSFCGSPETVFAQLERLREEVGAGVVNLIFNRPLPRDVYLPSMELFGKKVLPRMHEL